MTESDLKLRRERAARNAVATSALEGILPSQAIKTSLRQYVDGSLSLEQMLKAAQTRYARG